MNESWGDRNTAGAGLSVSVTNKSQRVWDASVRYAAHARRRLDDIANEGNMILQAVQPCTLDDPVVNRGYDDAPYSATSLFLPDAYLWIKGKAVVAQPSLDAGDMALGIALEFIDGVSGFLLWRTDTVGTDAMPCVTKKMPFRSLCK